MERYRYIQMPLALLSKEMMENYKLTTAAKGRCVYAESLRGMYGLKQARRIENDYLTKNIGPHIYYQCSNTHGMWYHNWTPIMFLLVVDDSGVKYVGKEHANILIKKINKYHQMSVD